MVFELDAILPLEFLISTLRVAKYLEWIGHKLSNKVVELEHLEKTRFMAIVGMYALKKWQKQFYDHHILIEQFKVGDLVLVFTLKEFVAKFTKQGCVPYVISKLSSNGSI